MVSAGEAVLGRVRVWSDALDPALARLRLEQVLAGGEWRPPGLPPSAILCVRRLADPRPGTLRLDVGGERPPPQWERALASALARLLTDAARPALRAVPAGAEAVLFADRAELLACLARDTCDGVAWTHWWWRGLLRGSAGPRDAVIATWLEQPERAPAAIELLAAWDTAARFASLLPVQAAHELAVRAAAAFGASALHAVLVAGAPATASNAEPDGAGSGREPPWRWIAPEAAAARPEVHQELALGVLLSLRRAPATARTRVFAELTSAWLAVTDCAATAAPLGSARQRAAVAAGGTAPRPVRTPARSRKPGLRSPTAPGDAAAEPPERDRPGERMPGARPVAEVRPDGADVDPDGSARGEATAGPPAPRIKHRDPRPAGEQAAAGLARPRAGPGWAQQPDGEDVPRSRPGEPSMRLPASTTPAPAAGRRAPLPAARSSDSKAAPEATETAIDTSLGGLFYLLNLALQLDLYGDFTRPLEPGIALDPWEFAYLLGVGLLGGRRPDPVWQLLTELAGRHQGETPGHGFRPPRAWRVPRVWLEPLDHDGAWTWSAAAGLLRARHPRGFVVVAAPRTQAPPAEQLRLELKRLAPVAPSPALRRTTLPSEPRRPLARWNARMTAYCRARLEAVLDIEPGESAAELLLAHRARVFATPSHLDVVLSLETLPVSIRRAGLDRDPGWIPAARRYLTFHFE
jgi:hypothetical protein